MTHTDTAISLSLGTIMGAVSVSVPDELLTFAGKIATGVAVALVTGLTHTALKVIFEKWSKKNAS